MAEDDPHRSTPLMGLIGTTSESEMCALAMAVVTSFEGTEPGAGLD
jgi:hypothetical protein